MAFQLTLEKITKSSEKGVCYLNDFVPHEANVQLARGRFINLITLSVETGNTVDSMVHARQILGRLHSEYFGSTQKAVSNSLRDTLRLVSEEFGNQGFELTIASVVILPNVDTIYVAILGKSSISLIRNNSYATILTGVEMNSVTFASGGAKQEDVLVLANNMFSDYVSANNLTSLYQNSKLLESFAGEVKNVLDKSETNDVVGCALVKFNASEVNNSADVKNLSEKQTEVNGKKVNLSPSPDHLKPKGFFTKLKSVIPSRKLYIHSDVVSVDTVTNKRKTLTLGLVLFVLLIVATYFGAKRKQNIDYKQSYVGKLTEAQQNFDQSKELVGLDDTKSRESYLSALNQVTTLLDSGITEPEVVDLKNKIDDARAEILKEVVANTEVFVDLNLVSEGFISVDAYLYEDELFILDKEGRIAKVNTQSKSTEIVAGPALVGTDTDAITAYDNLLFLLKNSREIEIIFGDGLEAPSTEYVTGRILMDTFAGNIYVLERAQNMIFRHQRLTQGYADAEEWLAEGIEADFSDAADIVIDGMIWVGYEDGTVNKFSNGITQPFSIQGVTPAIVSVELIFTGEETKNVYLFDPSNSRIVVLNKEGEFVLQYLLQNADGVVGITALEDEGRLLITQVDKIYSIELK